MAENEIKFRLSAEDAISGVADKAFEKIESRAAEAEDRASRSANPRATVDREAAVIREVERIRRNEMRQTQREAEFAQRESIKAEAARRLAFEKFQPIRFQDEVIPFRKEDPPERKIGFDTGRDHTPATRSQSHADAVKRRQEEIEREMAAEGDRHRVEADARRRLFGEEKEDDGKPSRGSRALSILQGGGEAAMASIIGSQLAGAASELKLAAADLRSGAAKWDETIERGAKGLPVIGGFVSAGRDIKDGLGLGVPAFEQWRGDKEVKADNTGWKRWGNGAIGLAMAPVTPGLKFTNAPELAEERQLRIEQIKASTAVAADARESEKYARFGRMGLAIDRGTVASRTRMERDYDPRRTAYMSFEGREQQDINRTVESSDIDRTAALGQAEVNRKRALQVATDYELSNSNLPNQSGTDLAAVQKKVAGMKADAANQYDAEVEKANLRFLQQQNETTEKAAINERHRGELLQDAWKQYAEKRFETSTYLYSEELRRKGQFDEAQIASVISAADAEKMERQRAFDEQVKDLDKQGAAYKQASESLAADLIDIEKKKQSNLKTTRQQQDREERDRTDAVGVNLRGRQASTREATLRATGQTQTADRLQVMDDLEAKRAAIRKEQQRQDELHGSDADKAKHAQEAEASLNAEKAAALTRMVEINSRNSGVEIDRGSQSSSGLLGGRLTSAEAYVQQRQQIDPAVLKSIEKFNGQSTAALEKMAGDMARMSEWIQNLK